MLYGAEVLQQFTVALIEVLQRITHYLPVHQVFGVQDRKAWRTLERRGRHVIVLTRRTHTDVRV